MQFDCRRAEGTEDYFSELAAILLQAPDPLPYLNYLGAMQKGISELQRENKRLLLHTKAAESEASSASEAVLKSRELERQVAKLQEELHAKVFSRHPRYKT